MIQRLLLLGAFWLFTLSILSAQVGFTLPVANNITPGNFVTLPVSVTNFDSVVGVQFVVQWNPAVLNFSSVLSYGLPNMSNEDFGLGETANGILRFAWESNSVSNGTTVADGTNIFKIRFQVVGQVNEGTPVTFTELPPTTIFEVLQIQQGTAVPLGINACVLTNGFVAVGYTLSTADSGFLDGAPVVVAPNPFAERATVSFQLTTGTDVRLLLLDAAGRTVLDRTQYYPPGQHGTVIELEENGIYYLILRTASQTCIRSLVKH